MNKRQSLYVKKGVLEQNRTYCDFNTSNRREPKADGTEIRWYLDKKYKSKIKHVFFKKECASSEAIIFFKIGVPTPLSSHYLGGLHLECPDKRR